MGYTPLPMPRITLHMPDVPSNAELMHSTAMILKNLGVPNMDIELRSNWARLEAERELDAFIRGEDYEFRPIDLRHENSVSGDRFAYLPKRGPTIQPFIGTPTYANFKDRQEFLKQQSILSNPPRGGSSVMKFASHQEADAFLRAHPFPGNLRAPNTIR